MIGSRRAGVLPVEFFHRPAEVVAPALLGAMIVSRVRGTLAAGRIVETEAYLGRDDAASHGYRLRRTPRKEALFGLPGTWYVYRSYGIHWCANLVCEAEGRAAAVLVRALEPVDGVEVMRSRRGVPSDRALCSGPGKLCEALGISGRLDGTMMPVARVTVEQGDSPNPEAIQITTRIGITKAANLPLRFLLGGSPWVSRG